MPVSAMKARFQIAECKAILTIMWCNQNEYNEQRGTTKDWLFPFVRLEAIVSGVSAIITKVATKRKMEKAPLLYDLTTLQKEANSQHGFTAEHTLLSIAQK